MYVGKRGEGSSTSHHLSLLLSKVLYTTKKNLPPFLLPPPKRQGSPFSLMAVDSDFSRRSQEEEEEEVEQGINGLSSSRSWIRQRRLLNVGLAGFKV